MTGPTELARRRHEGLGEEARALLRQILERQAYRQLMAVNIRGHGLKFLPDPQDKLSIVRDLEQGLSALERVESLYEDLGGGDLVRAVRGRMERIPYPVSRMELAACLAVCDLAERVAMESYVDSSCEELASIARSVLEHDRRGTRQGEELFVSFCEEETQRPHAQQVMSRWATIALRSLGRPSTPRDQRAVALGLRSRSCAQASLAFLDRLRPLVSACGLGMPDFAEAGLELPAGAASR